MFDKLYVALIHYPILKKTEVLFRQPLQILMSTIFQEPVKLIMLKTTS